MKLSLRDSLYNQLEATREYNEINIDSFDDSDDSWINCKKRTDDGQVQLEFSFNKKGTKLKKISVWTNPLVIDEEDSTKII